MRHHQLEWKAVRRQLLQGELDRPVGMAARALQRDGLPGQSPDRKRGELLVAFALHDHRSSATLQGLDAKKRRRRAGADRAVEHHVNTAAFRHLEDARERVLVLDIDHIVGPESLRHLEASGVFRGAGHDDAPGASLLRGHDAAEPLLSRALDEHRRRVPDSAVEESPLDAVGHRSRDARFLGRQALWHAVQDRVERQVHVVTEPAPQARCNVDRRIAISDGVRVVEPLGRRAVAVLSDVVPLTMTARQVVLQEDEIALFQTLVSREGCSDPGEVAHVLMPHHNGSTTQRQAVLADIGPADARDLDLHQRRIGGNRREIQLTQFSGRWADLERGPHFFRQSDASTRRPPSLDVVLRGTEVGVSVASLLNPVQYTGPWGSPLVPEIGTCSGENRAIG